MPNRSSALFSKASAILSSPNWNDFVIIIFKKLFFNSKSTIKETSVILFTCLKCHLFSKYFNGPSRLVTYMESSFLLYVTNLDGPLKHLENKWQFKEENKITEVSFEVDFELKNDFLNIVMTKSFQFGLDKIADAFQKRAEELFNRA